MKLLAVDKEMNVEIEPHCYEIEEFKNVIKRIKKTRGDTDGRKKELAGAERGDPYALLRTGRPTPCAKRLPTGA
jgi:hypothetical protein